MTSYKPGQVSALLFAGAKKAVSKNDNLAKLFSSTKPSTHVMKPTILSSSKVLPALDSINNKGTPSQPKLKEKKKKKKEKNIEKKVLTSSQNLIVDSSPKKSASLPFAHETAVKQKEANVTPGVSLKRKLVKDKSDDNEGLEKRPRRDRIRDRNADNRTIFVGNCPLTADKKELKKLFREFGEIETIRFRCAPAADPNLPKRAIVITKNFHEKCDNFVSYIVFKDEEAAKKSLVRNGYLLDGLHLRVDIAAMSKKHDKKRSIFVGNLPFIVSEEVIRAHFLDCGEVTNVRIVRDRTTNLGKGICYVQFESKDSVGLALKLNKTEIMGRPIRVMVCINKPKKKDEQTAKKNKKSEKSGKPKAKKITFAPSNVASSKFQTILKLKKERRFSKLKKKKENSEKKDGLSAIFGDVPAASKIVKFKKMGKGGTGKLAANKSLGHKKRSHETGSSFNKKARGDRKESSFKGKPKGNVFKGKPKGSSFKGKQKGSSFKGKQKGSSFKGKQKGSSFKGKGMGKHKRN